MKGSSETPSPWMNTLPKSARCPATQRWSSPILTAPWYQTTTEILFQEFRQVPLCNYTVDYTITLFEKRDTNATDEKLDLLYERQMFGDPRLVSLDLEKDALIIDAGDFNLVNKTFQVFIGMHVDVD